MFTDGSSDDVIKDFVVGAASDDRLDFSNHSLANSSGDLTLTQQVNDVLIEFGTDTILLQNILVGDLHEDDYLF